ncbi:SDR family NAD(P)-dependent oxidoreductase [Haloglomus litoreum]|uniref:SDR family NAD(P)-dependent oxidoreductase n=1 Tax=Haloglomus litoreum TaxID=3034026 RepID=UPI0023E88896|nr:SDR family oxidoreductase [Haloglomus sp. DT116]
MEDLLADRTAVVTGGASGIGRGAALALASQGADVVVADLVPGPDDAPATADLVADETGARTAFVECDVRDPDACERAVARADAFGGVDVLVNSAGVFEQATDFYTADEADFDAVFDVNVKGPYFTTQAAARRMREGAGGSIINVSSLNGLLGNGKSVTYSASKGAVKLLTYAGAHRLGPDGIRVNAIHPGAVETPMTSVVPEGAMASFVESVPLGRVGEPSDVAGAVVFLASDWAAYVSGASLVVDGGYANTGGITESPPASAGDAGSGGSAADHATHEDS